MLAHIINFNLYFFLYEHFYENSNHDFLNALNVFNFIPIFVLQFQLLDEEVLPFFRPFLVLLPNDFFRAQLNELLKPYNDDVRVKKQNLLCIGPFEVLALFWALSGGIPGNNCNLLLLLLDELIILLPQLFLNLESKPIRLVEHSMRV
jgi:hypothetical protein